MPIKPQRVYQEMNEFFGADTIFTTGCGLTQIWSGQFQMTSRPRTYLASGGAGTLGYDLPAAIGAKIARPEAVAVAVMGDGGFGFMMEELAMACQYKVPVVVVIVNNGYLSLIRQNQRYAYEYEYGVDLTYDGLGMDFVKLAEAFGAYGERVTKPDEIKSRARSLREERQAGAARRHRRAPDRCLHGAERRRHHRVCLGATHHA